MTDGTAAKRFALLTLTVTLAAQFAAYLAGFAGIPPHAARHAHYVLLISLAIPGLCALYIELKHPALRGPRPRLWPFPPLRHILPALLFLPVFGLSHAAHAFLGGAAPDWNVEALAGQMVRELHKANLGPGFLLIAGFAASLTIGPLIFAPIFCGAEWGWRHFLLSKLDKGRSAPAQALAGAIQALVFVPAALLGCFGGASRILTTLEILLLGAIMGVLLARVFERTRHLGLTALYAGFYLAQAQGMWQYLYPHANPSIAGPFGILTLLALAPLAYLIPALIPPAAKNDSQDSESRPI